MKRIVAASMTATLLAFAPTAWAQFYSGYAEANAAQGTVGYETVASAASLIVPPVAQSTLNSPGEDNKALASYSAALPAFGSGPGGDDERLASCSAGLPGFPVVDLSTINNRTKIGVWSTAAFAMGMSSIDQASLLDGLVVIKDLDANATCMQKENSITCSGSTTLSQLIVAGQTITLPACSIAPNTSIPVVGTVNVPLGPQGAYLSLPVSLTLILNEQMASGDGVTSQSLTVNGAHLFGQACLPGHAPLNVDMRLSGPVAALSK
jgi:hypothetical protein